MSQDKVIYIYNEGGTRKGAMVIDGGTLVEIQGFSAMILTFNCMSSNEFLWVCDIEWSIVKRIYIYKYLNWYFIIVEEFYFTCVWT